MNAPQRITQSNHGRDFRWQDLVANGETVRLCAQWLEVLRAEVPDIQRCFVFLLERGELRPAAALPMDCNLADIAGQLATAAGSEHPWSCALEEGVLATVPILWMGRLHGFVGVHLDDPASQTKVLTLLHWGAGWLVGLLARQAQSGDLIAHAKARQLLDLMAGVLAESNFAGAALAMANGLSTTWGATGAIVGWVHKQAICVLARSHASGQEKRSNLMFQAAAAMNEALDLQTTVQWVAGAEEGSESFRLPEHRALSIETRASAIATALLFDHGGVIGAVQLERQRPFSPEELEYLETQCMMLAPLLAQKRAAEQGLLEHARLSLAHRIRQLGDGSYSGWKLVGGLVAVFVLLAAIIPIPFHIAAPSVVEGEIQRAAVAPFQGYVQEAFVRAGDMVRTGQNLARLEDKDLQLERVRWAAEMDVALRKQREAMADGNRVDTRLAAAQAEQARAQLALVEERLRRLTITAPFDGVVVRGDLSQQLGSPVEQGKVLFELAPLDAWRVILKVDERDIAYLQLGQTGRLMLASMPQADQPISVKRITSVATAEEGRNYFRVEAALVDNGRELRPGMEGVAKVDAGFHSALWVGTRRLVDWVRLTLWEWMP